VCLTVIVILFAATPPPTTVDDPRVRSGEYYSDAYTAPFFWVYLVFLTWLLVQITVLSTRYARIAHRPLLRFGLRTIAFGALWGLAYVVMRMIAAVVAVLEPGRRLPLPIDAGVVLSFTTSILLVLIGSTIPSWGPLLRVDRLWFRVAALFRGAAERVRDASLRRVRITMEILDGYAMLRPWTSHQV
jgi:hypothetical protein